MTTIFDKLENVMVAELGKRNANGVQNETKLLGSQNPWVRPALAKIYNKYLAISEGFRREELTKPLCNAQIRQLIAEARNVWVKQRYEEEDAPKESEALPGLYDPRQVENLLQAFEPDRAKLAKAIVSKSMVVTYAPVLPLTKPGLMVDKLKELGIDASNMAGYAVLGKQIIVGVNNEEMDKRIKAYTDLEAAIKAIKAAANVAKRSPDAANQTKNILALVHECEDACKRFRSTKQLSDYLKALKATDDIIEMQKLCGLVYKRLQEAFEQFEAPVTRDSVMEGAVAMAEKALGKKLVVYGSPIGWFNGTWAWLATEKEINMLQRCSFGGHFSMLRWSFAFAGA